MNLLSKTIFFKKIPVKFYILLLFILLHLFLFNVNSAEWGDSYRILKASEYIRKGTYPGNEKRPPLFPFLIASRPDFVDAVSWGRVVMLMISIASFFVFDKLVALHIKSEKYRIISLLIFIFNPIYLYWSLRIMSDVPFSLFVLLAFYLLSSWKNLDIRIGELLVLGVICGLAILTRFEGYLLFTSVFIGILVKNMSSYISDSRNTKNTVSKPKISINLVLHSLPKPLLLGLTTSFVILPWIVYSNPLGSRYFDEPSGRMYDFKMVWIYLASLIYTLGFTSAFYFISKKFRASMDFFRQNVGIATFIALELILILMWPAAIPRLFIPLIPFFIIIFTMYLQKFDEEGRFDKKDALAMLIFLMFYVLSQYVLRLQFLIPSKNLFIGMVFVQIISVVLFTMKKTNLFKISVLFSMIFWSLGIIYIHKDIHSSASHAADYVAKNLSGKVFYNGMGSIFDWYLNHSGVNKDVEGDFYEVSDKKDLDFDKLSKKNIDYLVLTNEDDYNMHFDITKRPYLVLEKEFRYNVDDKVFFSRILRFNGDYEE